VSLFGPFWGEWLLASALGIVPGLGVYIVMRAARCGGWSLVALLVVAGSSAGEATAWGGLPQLIGLGLAPVVLYAYARAWDEPTPRRGWTTGLLLFLLLAATHLIAAQVAVALVVVTVLSALRRRDLLRERRRLLALLARVLAPSLLLGPLYYSLLVNVGSSFQDQAPEPISRVLSSLWSINGEVPRHLLQLLSACALALPVVLVRRWREPLWRVVAGLAVAVVVTLIVHPQVRLIYLVPQVLPLSFGLLATRRSRPGETAGPRAGWRDSVSVTSLLLASALFGYVGVSGLLHFSQQHDFYGRLLPPGTIEAITWTKAETAKTDRIAVAPVDSYPFGWWVEGLGQRATLTGSAQVWLNFPRERALAHDVDLILAGDDPASCHTVDVARQVGANEIFLPSLWLAANPRAVTSLDRGPQNWVIYRGRGAVILRVAGRTDCA
jgi:hypothetical protein